MLKASNPGGPLCNAEDMRVGGKVGGAHLILK